MVNVHQFDDYSDDDYDPENPPPLNHASFNDSGGTASRNGGRVHPLQNGGGPGGGGWPTGESQKLLADFDAFSSDAEKLSAILKCADVEGHKHTLSVDYYRFRKYLLFVPIVLMSLMVAILGFVAASDIMKDTMRVHDSTMQEFLTLLVATFGFLVLLLTLLGNGLDYNAKVRFHRAAAEDLQSLCDRVRLYRMERAMDERAREEDEEMKDLFRDEDATDSDESSSSDEDEPMRHDVNAIIPHQGNAQIVKRQMKKSKKVQKRQEKLTRTLVKQKVRQAREEQELSKDVITFYGYHAELQQIASSCRDDVPPCVSKFFGVMENRVELMSLSRLGVEEESRMRKNQIVRLCANEIYNEVENFVLWPLWVPNVDTTVETSLKRVGQLLNMNYRAQRRCKLLPCCAIPLCCKKARTDNVFTIINEGIDQRELDMMQQERQEMVRMENEKRAKLMAGPEEVLEMKDTVYSAGSRTGSHRPQDLRIAGDRSHGSRGGRSRGSRSRGDPDGSTIGDCATEASHSVRGGGGYANQYMAGGQRGQTYSHDPDDVATEAGETLESYRTEQTEGSYRSNDGTGTYRSGASYRSGGSGTGTYRSGASYGQNTYDGEEEEGSMESEEESAQGKKKKSKKKKKKKDSKKKKKKKEKEAKKSKKKEESESEEEAGTSYSEDPEEGEETGEEYSEYSDAGFTQDEEYSEHTEYTEDE
ncbi:hypothetical protein ACHAWF_010908 [Thalassiosira exigua]